MILGVWGFPQQDSEWLYHLSVQSTRYLAIRATLTVPFLISDKNVSFKIR